MSESAEEIRRTIGQLVEQFQPSDSTPANVADQKAWKALDELGFIAVAVPEDLGGSGGDLEDMAAVVAMCASLPVPIADAGFIAGPLLAAAGLPLPPGPVATAIGPDASLVDGAVNGVLSGIDWLSSVSYVVVLGGTSERGWVAVCPVNQDHIVVEPVQNPIGAPRATAQLTRATTTAWAELPADRDWLAWARLRGAAARSVQIAAVIDEVLRMTTTYVNERTQFGRPLVDFQAVQQQLASLAADAAATNVAADLAVQALTGDGAGTVLQVTSAKSVTSTLAGRAASVAHQLHGAIGFTTEHRLGARTRQLWSWRDDFGSEQQCNAVIARLLVDQRLDGDLWTLVAPVTPIPAPRQSVGD